MYKNLNINAFRSNRDFESASDLEYAGFQGFHSVDDLQEDSSLLPHQKPGIYFVLHSDVNDPEFFQGDALGFSNGKNLNVSMIELKNKWVDDALVVYIGKSKNLRKRVKELISFCDEKDGGHHWGGRYLWHIKDAKYLLYVCWAFCNYSDIDGYEIRLQRKFEHYYRQLPFANLKIG